MLDNHMVPLAQIPLNIHCSALVSYGLIAKTKKSPARIIPMV